MNFYVLIKNRYYGKGDNMLGSLKKVILYCLIIIFTFFSIAFTEDVLYVQSVMAKVYSKPSFNSDVLFQLNKGYKIEIFSKEGNWVKVTLGGKTGYISSFLLGKNPPLEKVTVSKEKLSTDIENPRSRVSHTTAVAGVRGLSQERRARLGKEEKVDYEALEKIESINISEDELKNFMKEGNL